MLAIVEAASQIVESGGEDAATTAAIAARAGVSIGSVYQYFDNRDAILAAMIRRDRETIAAAIARRIAEANPQTGEALVRDIIGALLAVLRPRRQRRRLVALAMAMRSHDADETSAMLDRVADLIASAAARYPADVARPLTPVRAYVLTRAVMGAIRSAMMENAQVLDDPAFEEELARLAIGYLRG